MSEDSTIQSESSRRRRRIGLGAFCGMVAIVGLSVFHSSLLQFGYRVLVVDQPIDGCRYAMLMTLTPECFDRAAELLDQDAIERFLIVDKKPRDSMLVGAHPFDRDVIAEQLAIRDVSGDRFREIETDAITPQQMFRELDQELKRENGDAFGKYRAFCCETHRYPNGPNLQGSPGSITKANEPFRSQTLFRIIF